MCLSLQVVGSQLLNVISLSELTLLASFHLIVERHHMSDAPLLTFPHFISGGSIGFLSLHEGKFFGGRLLMSDAPLIKGEAASSHVLLSGLSIYNVFLLSIFILLNIRKVIIIYFTSFINWRIFLIQFNPFVDIRNHFFTMLPLI